MRDSVLAVALLLGCLVFPTAHGAPFAYAGTQGWNFGIIDLATGTYTTLGSSGQTLAGLAALGGTLYATDYHQSHQGMLYSVDPTNGALTAIGSSGVAYEDFGATTSGLYAISVSPQYNLYQIDPSSGSATLVGSTLLPVVSWSALSNGGDSLYVSHGTNLYRISTTDGTAAPIVGPARTIQFSALGNINGTLYGSESSPQLNIATLNTNDGTVTVGPSVTGYLSGTVWGLVQYPLVQDGGSSVDAPLPPWSSGLLGAILVAVALRNLRKKA